MVSPEDKEPSTALLVQILLMEEPFLMPTTKLAFMLESRLQELILKRCLVNSSFRLALAAESKSEIISGLLDTFLVELQKTLKSQYLMILSYLSILLVQVAMSTTPPKL